MDLKEFVDSLSLDTFEHLRVAVVARQSRQAQEFAEALEFLLAQPELMSVAIINPVLCVDALATETGFDVELMAKVVSKYRENLDP